MSAREMFEELGYELNKELGSEINRIYYEKKTIPNYPNTFIMFDLDYQIISNDCDITINEFKAIQKQIEELGWLDE